MGNSLTPRFGGQGVLEGSSLLAWPSFFRPSSSNVTDNDLPHSSVKFAGKCETLQFGGVEGFFGNVPDDKLGIRFPLEDKKIWSDVMRTALMLPLAWPCANRSRTPKWSNSNCSASSVRAGF